MKHLLTLFILSGLFHAHAQVGRSFSLLEAKDYALKNHIKVKNADLEYNKAIEKKKNI
jgi:hypothetical protein